MTAPRELHDSIRREFFGGQAAALTREEAAEAFVRTVRPVATDDFFCVMDGATTTRFDGLDGLRSGWRDFLAAFEMLTIHPGDVFEFEGGVLEYVHLTGRPIGIQAEIEQDAAAIWRVRHGKLASVEFHIDRARARRSAGLAE